MTNHIYCVMRSFEGQRPDCEIMCVSCLKRGSMTMTRAIYILCYAIFWGSKAMYCEILCVSCLKRGSGCHPGNFSKSICERCIFLHSEWICYIPKFCWNIDEKLHYDISLRAKCPIMRVLCSYESYKVANCTIKQFCVLPQKGFGVSPRKIFQIYA